MTVPAVIKWHNIAIQLADESCRLSHCANGGHGHYAGIGQLAGCREAQLIVIATTERKTMLPFDRECRGKRVGTRQASDIDFGANPAGDQELVQVCVKSVG